MAQNSLSDSGGETRATTIRLGTEAEAALTTLCARWPTMDRSTVIRRALVDHAELLLTVELLRRQTEPDGTDAQVGAGCLDRAIVTGFPSADSVAIPFLIDGATDIECLITEGSESPRRTMRTAPFEAVAKLEGLVMRPVGELGESGESGAVLVVANLRISGGNNLLMHESAAPADFYSNNQGNLDDRGMMGLRDYPYIEPGQYLELDVFMGGGDPGDKRSARAHLVVGPVKPVAPTNPSTDSPFTPISAQPSGPPPRVAVGVGVGVAVGILVDVNDTVAPSELEPDVTEPGSTDGD